MGLLSTLLLIAASVIRLDGQTLAVQLTSSELGVPTQVPFSFDYNGKQSTQFLTSWKASQESGAGNVRRFVYTDPATALRVTAEVRLYPDFPGTIDWLLKFRNDGSADTPILENILPLDWKIAASPGDCHIRHARGSDAHAEDFRPLEEHFGPGREDHIESPGGDPSSRNSLPFFNLQTGDQGFIAAIGWTGSWKADFLYAKDGTNIAVKSGMKRTHLVLHPGEEIRTPRIVLMSWTGGDWQISQNAWRRLLLAHYSPQQNGKPMPGPVAFGSWGSEPIADKIAYVRWVHDHGLPFDLYGVDAGWYGSSFGAETDPTNPWWKNRGDWFPSPRYYPNGIKPLGQALKGAGLGFSLWIEPETSMPDKQIINQHPDWFLHSDHPINPGVALANFSNPAALKGITQMVSNFITDFGMTWYRQDFNIPPERYWELADTPDRIGMSEIAHVEGLYKMWDQLLADHPGLQIDNCASGGRRIDIEMMSRSFVVWRTDHGFLDTLAEQAQTQALALWVPENMGFESYSVTQPWKKSGPYSTPESLYLMRLSFNAGYGIGPGAAGLNNESWVKWVKDSISEFSEVQPYFYGDFYPLVPYSLGEEAWTAWQWDLPEDKTGLVVVLRRPRSPYTVMELGLKHLKADSFYDVEIRTTHDKGTFERMKGSELSHMHLQLNDAPSSTLIFYRRSAD